MSWSHTYTPLGSLGLSTLIALLPFVVLCWQLLWRKAPGHRAGLGALAVALALAMTLWDMPPALAGNAALYGLAFGAFPIAWIILCALWLYEMTVEAGLFEQIKHSMVRLSDDRRVQAVFIAFAFGALLENTAGYGAPVAIGAAMLAALGFPPLRAAALCLVANTVPVAYAGMGLPAVVAAQVSGLDPFRISQLVGSQLPLLALFVPLWLSVMVSGWRAALEIWPVLLAGGLGSALPTFVFARWHGYTLPGLMGALGSLAAIVLVLRFWKPKTVYRFPGDAPPLPRASLSAGQVLRAWSPWFLLCGLVILSASAPIKSWLDGLFLLRFGWPGLEGAVLKSAPLAAGREALPALFQFNPLSSPGSVIFFTGALLPLLTPGYSYARAGLCFVRTLARMRFALLTVLIILALAQVMNFSGMSYTLGLAVTGTGVLFPLFAPVLGWTGVFLTGSDTSSNALFCGMQRSAAEVLGMDPYLAAAANTSGGVTAKMVSPQSIAVAVGATGLKGREGDMLRATIGHSLLMLALVCLLTWLGAALP